MGQARSVINPSQCLVSSAEESHSFSVMQSLESSEEATTWPFTTEHFLSVQNFSVRKKTLKNGIGTRHGSK